MCEDVLRRLMTMLFIAVAVPLVNAQVHVGDILCEGNGVISSSQFTSSGYKAIGVVFYVDATEQHGWAVALDNIGKFSWGPNYASTSLPDRSNKQKAVADLDGYSNTQTILSLSSESGSQYPAFDTLDFSNGWYLPALGQLKKLYDNHVKVNEGLNVAGGTPFPTEDDEYWSSTEFSSSSSWFMDATGELHCKDDSFNGTKDGLRLVRGVRAF